MLTCSRCGRSRREKFVITRKNKWSCEAQIRCRARSVCSSIARRNRERREQAAGK
jgi:hypothetical protein